METLLPLYAGPLQMPAAWRSVADRGDRDTTVVLNVADGPGRDAPANAAYAAAAARLDAAGVPMLGYVDLGYAVRPLTEILGDVGRWTGYPVRGLLLDHAPTTPFSVGPVALAVRAARRNGLDRLVLNPATPPDPVYRDLGVRLCVFEGPWEEYREWSAHGSRPGDGHLVYGVPRDELDNAGQLLRDRGAGFGLVTDLGLPAPYAGLPSWYPAGAVRVGA